MSINNKREKFIRRDELGRRTARVTSREKKKFEQLLNTGMDYAAIGRATDRDPRTVEKYLKFKNDKSAREPGESDAKQQHYEQLYTLVSRIRSSIVNPDTESRNYPSYTSTWRYGGQDWRLTISSWAMLMLPYLDDEKLWSKPIPIKYLYEHIKSSSFKQHYDELNEEISKFKKEFFDAAEKIKVKNPQMIANWDTLNDKLDSDIANYKPMHGTMLPDDVEPLLPNFPFYEDILELFKKHIADLDKRYMILEDLLQQLYDDLDKDTIQDVIKKGSCDLCRAKPGSNRKVA